MTGLDKQAFWERVREELPRMRMPDGGRPLFRFADEVARWSDRMHLVGKRNIAENVGALVLDSLHLLRFVEDAGGMRTEGSERPGSIADIGSGAGFPGMVWKIVRPALDISLFERREKPSAFLERTIAALGLEGVRVIADEAAGFAEVRPFGLVVSKAAGRIEEMGPIAERMLGPGGVYVTIKGPGWREEIAGAGGFRLESTKKLPKDRGTMIIMRKRT